MQVETISDQLFFSTVYVRASSGGEQWSGTAFAYATETDRGSHVALVSNKHVLVGAETLECQLVKARSESAPLTGEAVTVTLSDPGPSIEQHPDPAVDVAVMPFGGVLNDLANQDRRPFLRAISSSLALSPEMERNLGVLAVVHTAQVGGRVVSLPAQQTVQINAPIGLGIVYKARTIDELVDRLLAREAAQRLRPSTAPVT